jgi:hypothetical protein
MDPPPSALQHNERVANTEEVGSSSVSTGLVVGMLIGIVIGLPLGGFVFDNMAIGLMLGSGAGGVLGVTFTVAQHSRRQSP